MNRQYENCGPTEILGHSPGVTFTADLSEFQEKTLIEGGGLKVVGEVPAEPVEPDTPEELAAPVVDLENPAGDNPPPPPGGKQKEGK